MLKSFRLLPLIAAFFSASTLAINAQGGGTIKVETHLIETTLSVHDEHGKNVGDLNQNDFTITEDGIPQTVRYFASRRQLPLSIGILVDESESQDKFVKQHEKAVQAFLRDVMEPADHAFAVCFGNHLRLVSDWTSTPSDILDGIHKFDKGHYDFPFVGEDEDRVLGTAVNDAVYFSIDHKLAAEQGRRKVIIVFSDGEENSSEHDLIDAIEKAQNTNVLVYAIRTTENKPTRMTPRDRYGMRELDHLTAATGGADFDAQNTNVEKDFEAIAADLRNLYEIGYYSTNKHRDGSFRKVVVGLTREDLTIRSRSGYTAR